MGDLTATSVGGVLTRGYRRGTTATDPWDQYVVVTSDRVTTFQGRAASFRVPGRATATQTIATLLNGSGSGVTVMINRVTVDLLTTVVKGATVLPPTVRINRITAHAGGTAITKMGTNTGQFATSASGVVAMADASADGTNSGTALTHTSAGLLSQKFAPRLLTAVGYEPVDTLPFFDGLTDVYLVPGQGIAISLEGATASTGNPATDFWVADIDFEEFTRP